MKLSSIWWHPHFEITFTPEQIEAALACSRNHYDGVCKDASSELLGNGRCGFLVGIKRVSEARPLPVSVTWRELDTLAKILEMGQYLPDRTMGATAFMLHGAVMAVIRGYKAFEQLILDDTPAPVEASNPFDRIALMEETVQTVQRVRELRPDVAEKFPIQHSGARFEYRDLNSDGEGVQQQVYGAGLLHVCLCPDKARAGLVTDALNTIFPP